VQRAQGSRVTDAAVRSASKNEILTKALNDLQEQLDKIGSGTVAPGTKAPSPKGPSKEKRARGHRETRAEVRASLEEKRINLTGTSATAGATKKKVAKKVGKKPASIKGTVSKKKSVTKKAVTKKAVTKKAVTKKAVTKKAVKKAPRKKATKKKAARKTTAEKMSSIGNPLTAGLSARLNLNPSDQQATKTKAKKARIRQAGLTTRTRGHISARGRRAQGRRDSRG
jgi:1,4-alpha-glucan branching enzyme